MCPTDPYRSTRRVCMLLVGIPWVIVTLLTLWSWFRPHIFIHHLFILLLIVIYSLVSWALMGTIASLYGKVILLEEHDEDNTPENDAQAIQE